MSELSVKVKVFKKRQRSASFKVQRRRVRLIMLWNTVKRFSVGKAADCLGVSRWTVMRDLAFLQEHDLLRQKRSSKAPFEVLENQEDFFRRFSEAQKTIMVVCEGETCRNLQVLHHENKNTTTNCKTNS